MKGWYTRPMKNLPPTKRRKNISVTLSPKLIAKIDRKVKSGQSRSGFIEAVILEYFARIRREKINRRDIRLINANIHVLNRQAMDSLEYQAPIKYSSEEQ
jgi:metal-responsive CopG/Arc/MetJ family transcriptional regulator